MYDCVYSSMADNGVAIELPETIMYDRNGEKPMIRI
jgi:hypothetical protein